MNNRKADSLKKKALEYVSSRTIAIDRKTFVPLTEFYVANMPDSLLPYPVKELLSSCGGDFSALSGQLYSSPLFTPEGIEAVFSTSDAAAIKSRLDYDPGFVFFQSIADNFRKKIIPAYKQYDDEIAALMKDYMKAQTEIFTNKAFFPDANLTLRASYGQVKGMQARDGLCYLPQTYLDGVIEKYVPGDYEYDLPERLIERKGLRPLRTKRAHARMLHSNEPHLRGQFRLTGDKRARGTYRAQLRPPLGRHDERP